MFALLSRTLILVLLACGLARAAPEPSVSAPEVLFTFDDGPSLERTPKILDILDQYRVKAVFFVVGWRFKGDSPKAEAARRVLRDASARGHAIGNHTVHHYFLCGKRGAKLAASEIKDNAELIEQVVGIRPDLFRTPYGSHCRQLSKQFEEMGVTPIGWDIDPQDWRLHNTKRVRDYVVRALKRLDRRAILLFHDVHPGTVGAVAAILAWIEKENLARRERGAPEVRIIDYAYLIPPHPIIPPVFEELGRILVDVVWPGRLPRLRFASFFAEGAR